MKPVIVAALLGVLTIVCMYVTFITDAPTEKTDSQIMQSRIEGTLMSGDYTYVVDGTELATLDNMTVANLRKYRYRSQESSFNYSACKSTQHCVYSTLQVTAWKEYVSYI